VGWGKMIKEGRCWARELKDEKKSNRRATRTLGMTISNRWIYFLSI